MAESLLAHLYTHIKGSQEDVATLSLQYILSQSAELNLAFTKQIAECLHIDLDDLQYTCQSVGENQERPDLAGVDFYGNEQVLCEMKFYAGLTENQPLGYLDRLKKNNGKGLLFICPQVRQTNLWATLQKHCPDAEYISPTCISFTGIHMGITNWSDILTRLNNTASSVANHCLSDIKQLIGFCAQMDSDAFLPFTQEDFSPEVARKAERYYAVIDETINVLCADKSLDTSLKGLRATANRDGYLRSVYIDSFGVSLAYDRVFWKNTATLETPFWVSIRNKEWAQPTEMQIIHRRFPDQKKEDWGHFYLALEPLTNATLDEVCQDLKRQILEYLNFFR